MLVIKYISKTILIILLGLYLTLSFLAFSLFSLWYYNQSLLAYEDSKNTNPSIIVEVANLKKIELGNLQLIPLSPVVSYYEANLSDQTTIFLEKRDNIQIYFEDNSTNNFKIKEIKKPFIDPYTICKYSKLKRGIV